MEVNGAAARLVELGDRIIVLHHACVDEREYREFHPRVVLVHANNSFERIVRYLPDGHAPAEPGH